MKDVCQTYNSQTKTIPQKVKQVRFLIQHLRRQSGCQGSTERKYVKIDEEQSRIQDNKQQATYGEKVGDNDLKVIDSHMCQ